MQLSLEQQIIVSSCRISYDMTEDNRSLFEFSGVDWSMVIKYACKNKVLGILYDFLVTSKFKDKVPQYYLSIMDDVCSCNYIKNMEKLSELNKISKAMQENNVLFSPVKGGYLIDNVYKNRKIRATNDIDALIKRKDIKKIDEIMNSNGYIQGRYDLGNNRIVAPTRDEKMLYKLNMYSLLPYIKIDNDIPKRTVIFDLSFALDFSLNTKPVEEMLDMALQTENGLELLPEHFLVHMCCHHYREASNVAWIMIGKDLNLIKFCDVREFILQKMNTASIAKAIQFAKNYNLEKALYFTIYFTREIYNDGYETEILKSLDIEDETFLYQFGEKDYDELQTRKKDFWTSLFSDNNRDELSQAPKYESLMGGGA